MTGEALAVHESDVGDVRLLEVFGELDLASAPKLCSLLDAARAERVKRLVVDLTSLAFCDSTGLRALIGSRREVVAGGGQMVVVAPADSAVGRMFALAGAHEVLPVYEDSAAALAALAPRVP